jgi:hypothetical protein
MTDDLVKRLRELAGRYDEAAERIEELDAALVRSFNHMMEDGRRIEKLEAALREIKAMHHDGGIDDLSERDDRTYCMVCDALEGKDE